MLTQLFPNIGLGFIAAQRGDVATADQAYARLKDWHGTSSSMPVIVVDRLLGLLCAVSGRLDDARAHFEDSLAFCEHGYRPEYAWTASDYAETILDHGTSDDRDRGVALQDEALTVARELGMHPLMERVLARREILKA